MNFDQKLPPRSLAHLISRKHALMLCQFFLIIFSYHILKDLKDTLVVTASDAGAEVIPFIKIWVILPFSVLASFVFLKLLSSFGREKAFVYILSGLLLFYVAFAFLLYPNREAIHLDLFSDALKSYLPAGCKGFIAMLRYWSYTLFYLMAELWSMMILSVLFWGQVNDANSLEEAKKFYPVCVFAGNLAGILSGQLSRVLCHSLAVLASWQVVLQIVIALIVLAGIGILILNRKLSFYLSDRAPQQEKTQREKLTFKESLLAIFDSQKLLCIALLVVGFSLANNLIDVIWKGAVKNVHPSPEAYNGYINQVTSMIGLLAVLMSLASRYIFNKFHWNTVVLATPAILFTTSFLFFGAHLIPSKHLDAISALLNTSSFYLIMTLGSIHTILALTSKYTLFDTCKELAFLSIGAKDRLRAKSVIDSIGSRLGKSGSSCLYQALLVLFGSTSGNIPTIAGVSLLIIGLSFLAARKLNSQSEPKEQSEPCC